MSINIFQLYNDEASKELLDPGFLAFEIRGNPRPDWREYWGIRGYFLEHVLEEDSHYGFFLPLFKTQTHLTAEKAFSFIEKNPGADVYTFSPFVVDSACYLNVFQQGEQSYCGMLAIMEEFFNRIDIPIDFKVLVNDFRTTVFCNYIVAKPAFWRTWFAITERIFDIAEHEKSSLNERLNAVTKHGNSLMQIKVFVIERIASAVLALTPDLKVANYLMPLLPRLYYPCRDELRMLNALKIAYMTSQRERYLRDYFSLREDVLSRCDPDFRNKHRIDSI
ncbi:hypothetical protein [Herbaspirillum sp. NPDC101396]|uniref:hypothetical protein n=1 Tax=Herbaspirillum sp. NPDC101396 TaxID=3364005 RepID=UPI00383B20F8